MKNIAVLVSGSGTNLQALIDAQKSGVLHSGRITLVLSSRRDAYALVRASDNGIITAVVDPHDFKSRGEFDQAVLKTLEAHNIDVILFAGFMWILGRQVMERYDHRIINIHPALIPSFCGRGFYGLHVHEAALGYGVKLTGATVHFVSGEVDGGEIILQKTVRVLAGDTPETLQLRVMEQAEWKIFPLAAELLCADRLTVDGRYVRISGEEELDI